MIVEPVAGSTGVLVPPEGYLARIRELCDRHGILLIFDEVITGFGRVGAAFAAERFGVEPDMITMAKGLTNATVPMSAVGVSKGVYDTLMAGPAGVELFHGYTYSGHPLACAAGLATLEVYAEEGLFERARTLAPVWEDALHGLRGRRNVIDIRNIGSDGGRWRWRRARGLRGARGFAVYLECFDSGLIARQTGDTIALSPPLIITEDQIGELADILGAAIDAVD